MKQYCLFSLIWMTLFSFSFAACSAEAPLESEKPLSSPAAVVPEAESNEESAVPSLPEQVEQAGFSYNSVGRRDPFRSIIEQRETRPKIVGSLPPLQRTDITDLRIQGIIWGAYGSRAIVNTPDGKGYTVRVGTLVGFNQGIIRQITQKKIIIEETLLNIFGETKKRHVVMELHSQKEG